MKELQTGLMNLIQSNLLTDTSLYYIPFLYVINFGLNIKKTYFVVNNKSSKKQQF